MAELKKPVRKFSETFSAETVIKERFFKMEEECKPPVMSELIDTVIRENPEKVARADETNLQWFVGQAMALSGGRLDQRVVRAKFREIFGIKKPKRTEISAILHHVQVYIHPGNGKKFAMGFIEADSADRFQDGLSIQTSEIKSISGNILRTRNSTYFVTSWGPRPVHPGITDPQSGDPTGDE